VQLGPARSQEMQARVVPTVRRIVVEERHRRVAGVPRIGLGEGLGERHIALGVHRIGPEVARHTVRVEGQAELHTDLAEHRIGQVEGLVVLRTAQEVAHLVARILLAGHTARDLDVAVQEERHNPVEVGRVSV
jgi:hypothetical protein